MTRATLMKAKRENLERLARYLRLHYLPEWSHGHLARLIHWRLSRKTIYHQW